MSPPDDTKPKQEHEKTNKERPQTPESVPENRNEHDKYEERKRKRRDDKNRYDDERRRDEKRDDKNRHDDEGLKRNPRNKRSRHSEEHSNRNSPENDHILALREKAKNSMKNQIPKKPPAYVIIRCPHEDLFKISQETNVWATQHKRVDTMNKLFQEHEKVILFFTVNNTMYFSGWGEMKSPIPEHGNYTFGKSVQGVKLSPDFKVEWKQIKKLPFSAVHDLRNGNFRRVRDGDELNSHEGEKLLQRFEQYSGEEEYNKRKRSSESPRDDSKRRKREHVQYEDRRYYNRGYHDDWKRDSYRRNAPGSPRTPETNPGYQKM